MTGYMVIAKLGFDGIYDDELKQKDNKMNHFMLLEDTKIFDVDTAKLTESLTKVKASQRTKNTSLNSFEARNCYVWPSGINILEN